MNSEKQKLISELNQKWELSNNTSYYKQFRTHKLMQMIFKITHFLSDNKNKLSKDDHHVLMQLIRAITFFIGQKSKENKDAVKSLLQELEKGDN